MKGFYVVFEGLDGAGKTTLMQGVAENLVAEGNIVFVLEGYADKKVKEAIKQELLKMQPNQKYLALLFAADRIKQMELIREKQYQQDIIILSSRSYISSLVYQTAVSDLSVTWIETLNKYCIEPDVVVFCGISVEEANRRIKERNCVPDGFENIEFLVQIKANYDVILKNYAGKVFVVDMERPPSEGIYKTTEFLMRK